MLNLANMNFEDFYFNGRWLSSLGGQICGKDGVSPFSVLPAKDIKSEKILGVDGEIVFSSNYQSRTFNVPIMFEDITRIREIAGWLNVDKPTDFYFKNDTVKTKVMFDSAIDFEAYALQGIVELKFIAHDPYFKLITEATQEFTSGLNLGVSVINSGNAKSYPLIRIEATEDVIISINDLPIRIVDIDEYIYLDTLYYTAYKGDIIMPSSCINKIDTVYDQLIVTEPTLLTTFPVLNIGANELKVVGGTVTKITVNTRPRWI